jgi:soluble lytic murein transglycosylase-like protein
MNIIGFKDLYLKDRYLKKASKIWVLPSVAALISYGTYLPPTFAQEKEPAYKQYIQSNFVNPNFFSELTQPTTTLKIEPEEPIENIFSLQDSDKKIYLEIFELQKKTKWKAAGRLIKKLDDKILVGHILYQKYMHPTAYNSTRHELQSWMLQYPDHPGARRIYNLAIKKNRGRQTGIHSPFPDLARSFPLTKPPLLGNLGPIEVITTSYHPESDAKVIIPFKQSSKRKTIKRKNHARNKIKQIKRLVKRYLRRNSPNRAEKRLLAFETTGLLNGRELEDLYGKISKKYFFLGEDEKALAYASYALSRNKGGPISLNHNTIKWTGALSAWRLGHYDKAAKYFSAVASHKGLPVKNIAQKEDIWFKSGAAFWAARAYEKLNNSTESRAYLLKAAAYPKTFYGLIAKEKLGQTIELNIDSSVLTKNHANTLKEIPQVNRAIALADLGQKSPADMELHSIWKRSDHYENAAILSLASKLGLPSTQLKISQKEEKRSNDVGDNHLYPFSVTVPLGGYEVDRALIFAMMRQESGFNSWAKSSAGARGMMQLMPATAGGLMNDYRLRYGSSIKLDEAEYNMALGQKYIQQMMKTSYIKENLFKALTAYNAGPGNLRKWLRKVKHQDDPLLFIESIPFHETRQYIERVVSNYWIYRMRLHQTYPSLKTIANNQWPAYISQEENNNKVAHNGN